MSHVTVTHKRNRRAYSLQQGYEPGSVMDGMSTKQRRAFNLWLRKRREDGKAYERGLESAR